MNDKRTIDGLERAEHVGSTDPYRASDGHAVVAPIYRMEDGEERVIREWALCVPECDACWLAGGGAERLKARGLPAVMGLDLAEDLGSTDPYRAANGHLVTAPIYRMEDGEERVIREWEIHTPDCDICADWLPDY